MDIFSNFIPDMIKTFRDSDLPWMKNDINNKVKLKLKLYHRYLRHKRNEEDFASAEDLDEIDKLISKSKKKYYQNISRMLNGPSTSSKTYWPIMKTFFNSKKVPAIPP